MSSFFLMVCSFNANEKNIYKYYPHFVFSKVLAWKIASLRIYGCTHLCMSFCGLYFHRQDSPLRQVALTTSHFIKVGEAHIIQPKLWITNWQLPLLNRWTVLLYNSHTHTHNAQRWRLSKCIQCIVDRIYRACVFFLPQIFYFLVSSVLLLLDLSSVNLHQYMYFSRPRITTACGMQPVSICTSAPRWFTCTAKLLRT